MWEPVLAPLTEIVSEEPVADLSGYDAVLFTSQNAVAQVPEAAVSTGQLALCVGQATTTHAEAMGFTAKSADGAANELIALASEILEPGANLIHIRGAQVRGRVAERLRTAGYSVAECVAYRARPRALSESTLDILVAGEITAVSVFSPRASELFVGEVGPRSSALPKTHAVAISPAAAQALEPMAFASVQVSQKPNADGMRASLAALAETLSQPSTAL
jgi:uroporphyrinogen-III synthase